MHITRLDTTIRPSQERVLIRPFIPQQPQQTQNILSRITTLSEKKVTYLLDNLLEDFFKRHLNTEDVLMENYNRVKDLIIIDFRPSKERKLLIGAYFTQEYALESAALFNPSIVPHPDQTDLKKGELRFIMSLRATGEGHISSIVFREGVIAADYTIKMREPTPFVTEPFKTPNPTFDKELFIRKLDELDLWNEESRDMLTPCSDQFQLEDLLSSMVIYQREHARIHNISNLIESIKALAYSNYEVTFTKEQRTSEKVIFPSSPKERNGIEDARFVYFMDDDGKGKYVSTYTAYDGRVILPQLLETSDFIHFNFCTLNGPAVKNKGMALFPKKIDGYYTMLSRQDNENIYVMYSNNIHFWYDPVKIIRPAFPWEYVQLGNCGSPIEVDEGWLVLSHGVGPMRRYCIGALLLDKKDPSKIIARLQEPLLQPDENERKGYVPNVVYTCGALIHKDKLILPYAMSDYATSFAVADIGEIINAMQ